ncbi:succinyl-coa synthetase beta chain [Holotrichia oblita]|uniref:Succinyl-coa synthetase beta chain n=1 Tax=Holotrichia oblita TaxID=644536 RepID=A0ACB9TA24_HOLOL|nr:succinyl-coa synthetase beta chain [Holotrichia oblita]
MTTLPSGRRRYLVIIVGDWSQEDEKEVAVAKFDLNYIALDGNIGCLVNGAGNNGYGNNGYNLTSRPLTNFLDVGGGATSQAVKDDKIYPSIT